jgi:hypothetical protein
MRLMERRHGVEPLQRVENRVVDSHWLDKAFSAVHDAVSGGHDFAAVSCRTQPVEEPARRAFLSERLTAFGLHRAGGHGFSIRVAGAEMWGGAQPGDRAVEFADWFRHRAIERELDAR